MSVLKLILQYIWAVHVNAFYTILFFLQTNAYIFLVLVAAGYLAWREYKQQTLDIPPARRML
jgi:hypothetical protein